MPETLSPTQVRRHRFPLLRLCLIALPLVAVAIAYHAALQNGFHFDDAVNIVRHGPMHVANLDIASLERAVTQAILPQRVLPNLTLAIDWWRGNGSPAPFQLTNILLHAATTLAVFALLLTAIRCAGVPEGDAWILASVATTLWAVHPIQVQAVTYVVQRMAAMAALFMLITLIAFIRARAAARPGRWYALAAVTAIAACLSKETAYILPALILLTEYTLCRRSGPRIRSRLDYIILALPVVAALYVVIDLAILHGPLWDYVMPGYASRDFSPVERLLTQPRVIFFHLGQILLPLPDRFSIEHAFPISTSLWHPWTTPLAIVGIIAWIAGGIWLVLRGNFPVVGFLVLWIPATLVIESSIVPLEMVFEHRMYLPSVGLAGLAGLGLYRLAHARLRPAMVALAAISALGLMATTMVRVPIWRTPVSLYEHALRNAPYSARVWANLATAYEGQDRTSEAIAAYTKALEIDPVRAITYFNRGSSYRKHGDLAAAEADYQRFISLDPGNFRGPFALGSLYAASGRYDDAVRWLDRVRRCGPVAGSCQPTRRTLGSSPARTGERLFRDRSPRRHNPCPRTGPHPRCRACRRALLHASGSRPRPSRSLRRGHRRLRSRIADRSGSERSASESRLRPPAQQQTARSPVGFQCSDHAIARHRPRPLRPRRSADTSGPASGGARICPKIDDPRPHRRTDCSPPQRTPHRTATVAGRSRTRTVLAAYGLTGWNTRET
jgi:protein O-mannosyl-transferase